MLGFEGLALYVLVFVIAAAWVVGITYLTLRSFEKYAGTFVGYRRAQRSSGHRLGGRIPIRVQRGSPARQAARQDTRTGVIAHRAR